MLGQGPVYEVEFFDKKKRNLYEAYDAKELETLKQCILQHGKDMEQEGISYDNEG